MSDEANKFKHSCKYEPESDDLDAITYCCSIGNELWVGNGEYSNRVNYCPWCGEPAKVMCFERKLIETSYD